MTIERLRRFLGTGKLKLHPCEKGRHVQYRLHIDNMPVALPTILCVSHGSGEATTSNLKGVSKSLGMTLGELTRSESCRIGRECILLLLCCEMLDFCHRRTESLADKSHSLAGLQAMSVSVELLIDHVENQQLTCWKEDEMAALSRIESNVVSYQAVAPLKEVSTHLLEVVRKRRMS